MKEREMLLRQITSVDFAITDLHLYLDTHPDDVEIAKKLEEYSIKSQKLTTEYEEKYGALTTDENGGNRWGWIADPWPWDTSYKEEC